jgi:hypothetical protein
MPDLVCGGKSIDYYRVSKVFNCQGVEQLGVALDVGRMSDLNSA